MYGTNDILQTIIRQSVKGYHGWRIEPVWVSVENNEKEINRPEILPEAGQVGSHIFREVTKTIILNNDVLILTNKELDVPINATLTLESHDNLFTITKAEYQVITFYKYQAFTNYLKISLKEYGNYVPFQLEFLRVKPYFSQHHLVPPFGFSFYGHPHGFEGNNCNNPNRRNDD